MRFRRRFSDVIDRQLDLFAAEEAALLERIAEALEAYTLAPRDEAEDRFAEYQEWLADAADALARMRDRYAATLAEDAAQEYETAFNRAVLRRFGDVALELRDDDE
jgi:hypothetical protein